MEIKIKTARDYQEEMEEALLKKRIKIKSFLIELGKINENESKETKQAKQQSKQRIEARLKYPRFGFLEKLKQLGSDHIEQLETIREICLSNEKKKEQFIREIENLYRKYNNDS